ncbi:sigma-70 family RNA polymerase sigma factor [Bordetella petrii]|uniref:sigma-70 family RNA polymerase sigma factor n=1 Tax=Bordetella petrii TaxID=94624 RepID=UPI001A96D9DA|nr:sigma-70 family RNA polymerase sigma factor [Bordetella petrii]
MSAADRATQQVHTLYTNHHGWLYGWLRRKLGNACDAADLAHDTFVRVMVSRRLPAQLGEEPRALLTHIAKGLVIDHWRRQDVERAYLEAVAYLPEPEVPSPETRLLIIEALMRIDAMLTSLPARTREVFLLAQLDGLTLHQIAERTRIPVITVRRHIHKALMACMAVA